MSAHLKNACEPTEDNMDTIGCFPFTCSCMGDGVSNAATHM